MPRSATRVLVLAVVVLLAACSAGLSDPETDACTRVWAWTAGGHEPDGFEPAVNAAQDALADVEETPLAAPLAALAGGAEGDRDTGAAAFMAVCEDHGWELPEG